MAGDYPTLFDDCVYIEDRYLVAVPDGTLLNAQQFRANVRYGGRRYVLDDGEGSKVSRNAWEALLEGSLYRPRSAHSVCFRPDREPRVILEEDGRRLYNVWQPPTIRAVPGDVSPFLRHLEKMLPVEADRQWLIYWMAAHVQYPGVKLQWAPVIIGVQGNGKTLILELLRYVSGEKFSHMVNAADIGNKFNGWVEFRRFIGVEEIRVSHSRGETLEAVKVLLTNTRVEIQRKGVDQYTGDNRANFCLTSNHVDAVLKTDDDRRYMMLVTAQRDPADLVRDGMSGHYFPELYAWARQDGFAHLAHWLQTLSIPDEQNPAIMVHRAPVTSTTAEAIEASRPPAQQAIVEAIEMGDIGFRGGWVSSFYLTQRLQDRGIRAYPNTYDRIMMSIGYHKHPALAATKGRAPVDVLPEKKKSVLWVKAGSIPALNLPNLSDALRAYSDANDPNGPAAARAS